MLPFFSQIFKEIIPWSPPFSHERSNKLSVQEFKTYKSHTTMEIRAEEIRTMRFINITLILLVGLVHLDEACSTTSQGLSIQMNQVYLEGNNYI